jgi:site-specific DNA-cytosine methylase
MGLSDDQIDLIKSENISDNQLYKMFGNSIVVDVLEEIFRNLFFKDHHSILSFV